MKIQYSHLKNKVNFWNGIINCLLYEKDPFFKTSYHALNWIILPTFLGWTDSHGFSLSSSICSQILDSSAHTPFRSCSSSWATCIRSSLALNWPDSSETLNQQCAKTLHYALLHTTEIKKETFFSTFTHKTN